MNEQTVLLIRKSANSIIVPVYTFDKLLASFLIFICLCLSDKVDPEDETTSVELSTRY